MVAFSVAAGKLRSPNPSFTYTKTFARLPPSAVMVSTVFSPFFAHTGSWLISILRAAGFAPAYFTEPFTSPTVLLSMGPAACCASVALLPSPSEVLGFFLPQPISKASVKTARRAAKTLHDLWFIIAAPFVRKFGNKFLGCRELALRNTHVAQPGSPARPVVASCGSAALGVLEYTNPAG